MKKLVLVVGVIGLIGMTSCNKDWTCECETVTNNNGTVSESSSTYVLEDLKPTEARTECDEGDNSYSFGGSSTSTDCEIKS